MGDDPPLPADLPLPDLDAATLDGAVEGSGPMFQVDVGAIRDPVAAAPRLSEILGVDLRTASRIASNAPGVLISGVSRVTADTIACEVVQLGVKARVSDDGAGPPPRGRSEAPHEPPPGAAPPAARSASDQSGPGDNFWVHAPIAFVAPFLGKGAALLAAAGLNGVGVALMVLAPGLCIKLALLIGIQLVAFGLFVEVFNRLAQAAIYRSEESWLPEPVSDLPDMRTLFWRGVVNLLVFALLSTPLWLVLVYSKSAVALLAGSLGLFLYWPMGLTVQSISGRLLGAMDVLAVGRGVIAAPAEYLGVCALTFVAMGGSTAAVTLVAGAGVWTLDAVGGGALSGVAAYCGIAFLWCAAIAYFHGVLGYLMGALVRSRSEAFEFLHGE